MSEVVDRPTPRPSRERGRKQPRAMAYQRALADLRSRHRDEFEELYRFHRGALDRLAGENPEVQP